MSDEFLSMKVRGLKSVAQALDQLPGEITIQISRKTLKASAEVVLEEVLKRVPVNSGLLRNSVRVRRTAGNPNSISISAGNKNAWYASLVEYGFTHTGHGRRKASRKPTSRGFVDEVGFMRKSAESQFETVVDTFDTTVSELVDKAITKMNQGRSGES